MSLKTLHLTNAWHATSGGIGTFYRSLLDAANATGHSLRLVVPGDRDWVEQVGDFGRIYYLRSAHAPLNRSYRMLYPGRYLARSGRIKEILNSERPDLIEVCDKYTLPYMAGLLRIRRLSGVNLRVPVIGLSCERMDENMAAYLSRGGLGKRFCRWYMKNIYFVQFDHHVANSEHTAEELREASRGHKVRRGVWVCPMGVNTGRYSPGLRSVELRERLLRRSGGSSDSALLLYVGRLVPEKNLNLLAEMLGELHGRGRRDYRLAIAGQGISQTEFARLCERLAPGHVSFLGHVSSGEQLARLYASADVFVHPNPREPFGIAPLEAMASGLPLVAPDRGGVRSYANGSNAWLAPAEAVRFAKAVESVLDDVPLRNRRVSQALGTAARFDWKAISRDFLRLYAEIIDLHHERGQITARPPLFYSTPGDMWGREVENSSVGANFIQPQRD
jgi:alpha-1,6-mannosyltransferase